MPIQRGVFTRGGTPWRYLKPLAANLFLSANEADVRSALEAGVPAARVFPHSARASDRASARSPHRLRRRRGPVFRRGRARLPGKRPRRLPGARARTGRRRRSRPARSSRCCSPCSGLQNEPAHGMRVRTALVTARSAPAHERAIRTLMEWNVEIDEAMFLGGLQKGEFLREFEPDFFFDDQTGHIENAAGARALGPRRLGRLEPVPRRLSAGRQRKRAGAPGRARFTPPYSTRIRPRAAAHAAPR